MSIILLTFIIHDYTEIKKRESAVFNHPDHNFDKDHLNLASSAGHHHLDSLGRIRFRPIRRRRWCQVLEKSCWHDPRQSPFFGRAEKNTISNVRIGCI